MSLAEQCAVEDVVETGTVGTRREVILDVLASHSAPRIETLSPLIDQDSAIGHQSDRVASKHLLSRRTLYSGNLGDKRVFGARCDAAGITAS